MSHSATFANVVQNRRRSAQPLGRQSAPQAPQRHRAQSSSSFRSAAKAPATRTPQKPPQKAPPKPATAPRRRAMHVYGSNEPRSRVQLTLAAKNLADRDVFSKSDPICIVYRVDEGIRKEVARTETISDDLNPRWNKRITVDYFFERKQTLVFKLYDIDANTVDLDDHDFLGECTVDLADILAAPHGYLTIKLQGFSKVRGHLIVYAEEIKSTSNDTLHFSIQGVGLHKRKIFLKPDAYLEFYRHLGDGSNFTIECHTRMTNASKLIGSVTTAIDDLKDKGSTEIPLVNPKKVHRANYTNSGLIRILNFRYQKNHSFLEYIKGGLQLEFAVCVDFTASNGPIHSATSLHHISPHAPNQYELAMMSVLEICQHYNHSKEFDAMGFGAKIPPRYQDLETNQRRQRGVMGVLESYRKALRSVELYGPTNFHPTIKEFAYKAGLMPKDGTRYQILLIITDGVITDMQKTVTAIVNASGLPLSIIIVGVGNDSFEKMDELDSDQCLLTDAEGRVAQRDIVQFVPFRNFLPPSGVFGSAEESDAAQRRLAQEVLAEVPDQVTSFMRMHNVLPKPSLFELPEDADIHTLAERQKSLDSAPQISVPYPSLNLQPPINPAFNGASIPNYG